MEWLADNCSCFTAHETLAFAHAIGLVPCFTPVRSPESNGIAEAFVKTFKRDYARLNPRPDAAAVMAALDRWFEDYNECTRTAPSGCARPASSSGRTNPPPVRSDGGNSRGRACGPGGVGAGSALAELPGCRAKHLAGAALARAGPG